MIKYREILRLHSQGISQRGIAASCQCSRNTASAVIQRADECGISWPFEKDLSDSELQDLMLGGNTGIPLPVGFRNFPEGDSPHSRYQLNELKRLD
ncbi:hypothetical protein JCM14036_07660 [Desulfotomaculum defluvii]